MGGLGAGHRVMPGALSPGETAPKRPFLKGFFDVNKSGITFNMF
jgi:hypothetical protein